ncbi:MAG: DegT/DnrJ/EryC1/StrS family aminotransferase [Candidatus Omnitrophota bacterium]
MMIKVPIIGSTHSVPDLVYALAHVPCQSVNARFKARLAVFLGAGAVHTLNSGLASFYLILEALKAISSKKEVILPAYTAGSLIVAVKKAGLKPVLCDISLDNFNADIAGVRSAIGDNTLAVVCVHMFGIPVDHIESVKAVMPDNVFLIEDCCQAMGSRIKDRPVGSFGDVSFFSFNRGKNLSANNGGCIITRAGSLEEPLRVALRSCPPAGAMEWLGAFFKAALFMTGTDPHVYWMGHALAAGFRETMPPDDLLARAMANFQISLGLCSMQKADSLFMSRYRNGSGLLRGLAGVPGVRLPLISPDILPVFNRMPILFDDASLIQPAQRKLWRKGIETSRMYIKPLHHMFDLGYKRDSFRNACYLADHLLTLPVHPGVRSRHIEIIIDTIRGLP